MAQTLLELCLTAGKTTNMKQLLSHMLSSAKHENVINLQMCHELIYTFAFFLNRSKMQ